METYKIPYQNLEYQRPADNELVRFADPDNPNIKYFALRKGNNIYQGAINPLGDIKDEAAFKSKYGVEYGSLTNLGGLANWGNAISGMNVLNWDESQMQGWSQPAGGGVVTKTVDPLNPNRAIDVQGDVPASQAAPANYLQNLLGSGQGVGGAYTSGQTLAQTQAIASSQVGKETKTLVDIANSRPDVLSVARSQGGDPFTAGTQANTWLNNWWNTAGQKEYPNVILGQPKAAQTSAVMSAENLGQGTPNVSLPGITGGVSDSHVAGAVAYNSQLQKMINELTTADTDTDKQYQSILNSIAGLTGQMGNKGADQLAAEQTQNIPGLKKQLADISGEITTKTAEYEALRTENKNKPITMSSIIGRDAAILSAKASEINMLTAKAQALTGQISQAQETANRAIDLKYSTIEAQINTYQAQLNALTPILNKEDRLVQMAQQAYLNEKQQAVADAKAKEKEKTSALLDMWRSYPDAGIDLDRDTLEGAAYKVAHNSRIYADRGSSGSTVSERQATSEQDYFNRASSQMLMNKQAGGWDYVDGNEYMELRRNFPGDPSDFDEKMSYLLSPADITKYSIGRWKSTQTEEESYSPDQIKSQLEQYKAQNWSADDFRYSYAQANDLIDSNGKYRIPDYIEELIDQVW